MTTITAHVACGALRSILVDFEPYLTSDTVSTLTEDINDVENRIQDRGLSIVMVDLPKLGKVYDKSLSSGYLPKDFEFPRSLLRKKKAAIFAALFDLSFRDGKSIDPEPEVVLYTRALLYLFKKARVQCPPNVVRKAHHAYFELDMLLRPPTRDWWDVESGPRFQQERLSFADSEVSEGNPFKGILDVLDGVCGWFTPSATPELGDLSGRHGPGAVSDMPSGEDKYVFPTWPDSLSRKFPPGHMMTNWGLSELGIPNSWGSAPRSKLIAVPKTIDKPRLIASEPTALMWCQQALLDWSRRNVTQTASICVNFYSQEVSRSLALWASQTGRLATVDLESASDRLSLWTVERAFASNPEYLDFLAAARSFTTFSELVGREARVLKFAAQGSALTFYVQSIIYAAAAVTAVCYDVFGCRSKRDLTASVVDGAARLVRVFGDDIILPTTSLVYLGAILSDLQLKIGHDKTHFEGNFRESCGMDAYKGVQVTPPYLPHVSPRWSTLELASWVGVHNHVSSLGVFENLTKFMRDLIPERVRGRMFVSNTPQAGLWLHTHEAGVTRYPNRGRWNADLQTWEYGILTVVPVQSREVRESNSNLLQYFTEAFSGHRVNGTEGIDLDLLDGLSTSGYYKTRPARLGRTWVSEV